MTDTLHAIYMGVITLSLKAYIITRILLAIPMMLILLTLIFFILRIMPGDPVLAMLGGRASVETMNKLRHKLGLDKPLVVQYLNYLASLMKGDLGTSTMTSRPVWEELKDKFPATIELTLFGFGIALLIGVFWGASAAYKRDEALDVSARVYAMLVYAIPAFWLALMFQLIFGSILKWFPIAGRISPTINLKVITNIYLLDSILTWNLPAFWDALKHLILPGSVLGIIVSSVFLRMIRNNTILMLNQDFVKAARARGIKEKAILYGHALKNAFIPVMTMMGLQLAMLLGGAVLTETTFSWPGMGRYLVMKIRYRDFPAIQGAIVLFALVVVITSIIVDVINALIDPRVRY